MNFQKDVLDKSHEVPVLVDFWAPWCGPCRVLGPTLDSLASKTKEWSLEKVNVDEEPELAANYGIRSIPTVIVFLKGNVSVAFSGALPEKELSKWIDQNVLH